MPKRKMRVMRKAKARAQRRGRPRRKRASATSSPAAIEAALAAIAHDIRTPLTGILALAELLASSDLGAREREWAQAIKSGAEHLSGLTTLIVDAVKADVSRLVLRNEVFSPRALAEAVGQALSARAASKKLQTELAIADDLPNSVEGDVLRLRAALENLADNAVKFTDTGTVVFTAGKQTGKRGRINLVFTVADTGIGIAPGALKKLFRPFAQGSDEVSRRYGGAGLGLVFVKRLAKAMHGDLAVTTKAGRGTAFRLTVSVKPIEAPKAPTDARVGRGRSLGVLCAEDNPYARVVTNTILTQLGHRADFVESGEAAVAAVARGGYDAVLMDVTLPGIDGLEATRRIRALPGKAGTLPVIGISGHSEQADETAARAAGMNFYFVKPVSPGKLARAFATVAG